MDSGDWRSELLPDTRQRIVKKIVETFKRNLPISGPEGLEESKRNAARFEEKIYTAAASQADYLRKISLKVMAMEVRNPQTPSGPASLPSNPAFCNQNPLDLGSENMQPQMQNQGQTLPTPVANQSKSIVFLTLLEKNSKRSKSLSERRKARRCKRTGVGQPASGRN